MYWSPIQIIMQLLFILRVMANLSIMILTMSKKREIIATAPELAQAVLDAYRRVENHPDFTFNLHKFYRKNQDGPLLEKLIRGQAGIYESSSSPNKYSPLHIAILTNDISEIINIIKRDPLALKKEMQDSCMLRNI